MAKVYYVMIKGRTLESRDLKELLARAVSEKRSSDRKLRLTGGPRPVVENASNDFVGARSVGMH